MQHRKYSGKFIRCDNITKLKEIFDRNKEKVVINTTHMMKYVRVSDNTNENDEFPMALRDGAFHVCGRGAATLMTDPNFDGIFRRLTGRPISRHRTYQMHVA